jgi:hypothetical protein
VEPVTRVTRIAVHKDNLAKGLPAVWLIEMDGALYEAEGWRALGPVQGARGQLPHGPTLWVETEAPVVMIGAQKL